MTHGNMEGLACPPREDMRARGEDRDRGRGGLGFAVVQRDKTLTGMAWRRRVTNDSRKGGEQGSGGVG
jgi:hypothetical protein